MSLSGSAAVACSGTSLAGPLNDRSGPALTIGARFVPVVLRRIAPHDAIRSVWRSPLRSLVFNDSTLSRYRSSKRSLGSPSENDEGGSKVPSPRPGRIETVSQVLKEMLHESSE